LIIENLNRWSELKALSWTMINSIGDAGEIAIEELIIEELKQV
jgi:hypothetical protein